MLASFSKLAEKSCGTGLQLAAELLSSPNAFHAFRGRHPHLRELLWKSFPRSWSWSCQVEQVQHELWLLLPGVWKLESRVWGKPLGAGALIDCRPARDNQERTASRLQRDSAGKSLTSCFRHREKFTI